MPVAVAQDTFAVLPDGGSVSRFRLTNANGVELSLISYGAVWPLPFPSVFLKSSPQRLV